MFKIYSRRLLRSLGSDNVNLLQEQSLCGVVSEYVNAVNAKYSLTRQKNSSHFKNEVCPLKSFHPSFRLITTPVSIRFTDETFPAVSVITDRSFAVYVASAVVNGMIRKVSNVFSTEANFGAFKVRTAATES